MKNLRSVVAMALVFLMLSGCGTTPQGTTPSTTIPEAEETAPETATAIPETTEAVPETTAAIPVTTEAIPETTSNIPPPTEVAPETTDPAIAVTIPDGYNYSFFWYPPTMFFIFCNFSIAPAGTNDWYPVLKDETYACTCHFLDGKGPPEGALPFYESGIEVERVYFQYDGPPVEQWILRIEFPESDQAVGLFENAPDYYIYHWDTPFELENNKSLLHFEWNEERDASLDSRNIPRTRGDAYDPVTQPMIFCPGCAESWKTPVG